MSGQSRRISRRALWGWKAADVRAQSGQGAGRAGGLADEGLAQPSGFDDGCECQRAPGANHIHPSFLVPGAASGVGKEGPGQGEASGDASKTGGRCPEECLTLSGPGIAGFLAQRFPVQTPRFL